MSSNDNTTKRDEEIRRRIEARMSALSSSSNHHHQEDINILPLSSSSRNQQQQHVDPIDVDDHHVHHDVNIDIRLNDGSSNHNNNNNYDDDDDDDDIPPPPPPIDAMPEELRLQLKLPRVKDVEDDSVVLASSDLLGVGVGRNTNSNNNQNQQKNNKKAILSPATVAEEKSTPIVEANNNSASFNSSSSPTTKKSLPPLPAPKASPPKQQQQQDNKPFVPSSSSSAAVAAAKKPVQITPDNTEDDDDDDDTLTLGSATDADDDEEPLKFEKAPTETSSKIIAKKETSTAAASAKTVRNDDDEEELSDFEIQGEDHTAQQSLNPNKKFSDSDDPPIVIETAFNNNNTSNTDDEQETPSLSSSSSPSLRKLFGISSSAGLPLLSDTKLENTEDLQNDFVSSNNNNISSSSSSASVVVVSSKTFASKREEGRCLAPSIDEEFVSSPIAVTRKPFSRSVPSSESIQLNFFTANQKVVAWKKAPKKRQEYTIWGNKKTIENDDDLDNLKEGEGKEAAPSCVVDNNNDSNSDENNKKQHHLSALRLWSDLERTSYKEDSDSGDDSNDDENDSTNNKKKSSNKNKKLTKDEKIKKERIENSFHTMIRSTALRTEPRLFDHSALRAAESDPLNEDATTEIANEALRSKLASCDILQLWDTIRDSKPRDLVTYGRFWTSDHKSNVVVDEEDATTSPLHRPLPLPAQFSRGVLLKLSINSISTQFHSTFGGAIADPIFLSLALYAPVMMSGNNSNNNNNNLTKLSETFYFTPQGQPLQETDPLLHPGTFVTFVPNEFVHSQDPRRSHANGRLIFILRIYRKLSSDWEYSSDMYVRPGMYRAAYHQTMQKSIVEASQHQPKRGPLLQELGFGSCTIISLFGVGGSSHSHHAASSSGSDLVGGHHTTSTHKTAQTLLFDKLFKSPKNLSDAQTFKYIADENKKAISNLKPIDIRIMMSLEAMSSNSVEPQIPHHRENTDTSGTTGATISPSLTTSSAAASSLTSAAEDDSFIILHEKPGFVNNKNTNTEDQQQQQHTVPLDQKRMKQEKMIEAGASPLAFASRYIPCCRPLLNAGCFSHYVNVLYLRLQKMNLAKLSSKLSNIYTTFVIQVCVKDNDDNLFTEGLPCMYSRFFGETLLAPSAFTSAAFNTKECEFNDEMKIQLPIRLHEKHHLFFTLYGMTSQCTAEEMKPIGHAAIQLWRNGGISSVCNAESLQLQIINTEAASDIKDEYLEKVQILPPGAFLCGGESVLALGTAMRSTVQTSHLQLSKAFSKIEQIYERAVVQPKIMSERFLMSPTHRMVSSTDAPLPPSASSNTTRGSPTTPNTTNNNNNTAGISSPSLSGTFHHQFAGNGAGEGDVEATSFLSVLDDLPSPELVAYGPLLLSSCLSIICSPSSRQFSLRIRGDAMRTFIFIAYKIHQLEVSLLPSAERTTSPPGASVFVTPGTNRSTTLTLFLYNYLTRDLFFTNGRTSYFVLAPIFADVLCFELSRIDHHYNDKETYKNKISDILWFLLDLILRDFSLMEATTATSSREEERNMDASARAAKEVASKFSSLSTKSNQFFGSTINDLVCLCVTTLTRGGSLPVVQRLSIFLRSLLYLKQNDRQKRGLVLSVMQNFAETLEDNTSLTFALVAIRFWLDCGAEDLFGKFSSVNNNNKKNRKESTTITLLPLPQMLFRIALRPIYAAISGTRKDLRAGAIILLHSLLAEVSYNHGAAVIDASSIASQCLSLIQAIGFNYASIRPLLENHSQTSGQVTPKSHFHSITPGLSDRRLLSAIVMWTLQSTPQQHLETWVGSILRKDLRSATGVLAFAADCVTLLHYTSSYGKIDRWATSTTSASSSSSSSSTTNTATATSSTAGRANKNNERGYNNDMLEISSPVNFRTRQSADLRVSGSATLAASRLLFLVSREMYPQLCTVSAKDSAGLSPLVYPYFRMLEVIISEAQPTVTQQVGALCVLDVTRSYFTEVIQGRARFAPGMVLLAMRLILSSSGNVRSIGSATLLEITRVYFVAAKDQLAKKNNTTSKDDHEKEQEEKQVDILKKFRTLFSAATISVAESYQHGRNMKYATDCVEDGLNSFGQISMNCDATSLAHQSLLKNPDMMFGENAKVSNALSSSNRKKTEDASGSLAATTHFNNSASVVIAPNNNDQTNQKPQQQQQLDIADFAPWVLIHSTTQDVSSKKDDEDNNNKKKKQQQQDSSSSSSSTLVISTITSFSSYVSQLIYSSKTLFKSIGQLPNRPEMRIQSIRPAAFYEAVWKFIDQKALRDVPRWIALLVETNKGQGDFLESALSHVFAAAFAYRVTQLFYKVHGTPSSSSAMKNVSSSSSSSATNTGGILPIFFNIVSWHDYCRLFPQLEEIFSEKNLHHLVVDAVSLPDHSSFTIDGQVNLLKTAAELFGKAHFFEWAIMTIRCVDTIVLSREDFRSCKLISDAIGIWCGHIGTFASTAPKRLNSRYYCVAVSFQNTNRAPEFRIFRYPHASPMTLGMFKEFAKDISSAKYKVSSEKTVLSEDLSLLSVEAEHFMASANERNNKNNNKQMDEKQKTASNNTTSTTLPSTCADVLSSVSVFSDPALPEEQPITVHCFEVQPFLEEDNNKGNSNTGSDNDEKEDVVLKKVSSSRKSLSSSTAAEIGKCTTRFHLSRRMIDQQSSSNKNKSSSASSTTDEMKNNRALTKTQLRQMSPAAKVLDAKRMTKNVVVFTVQAGFPNVTTNLPVTKVEERSLDPLSTALETVTEQEQFVVSQLDDASSTSLVNNTEDGSSSSDDRAIAVLFSSLTPLDVRPAGFFFTHLVRSFPEQKYLRDRIKHFTSEVVQKRLEKATNVSEEHTDHLASCWKAVVDVDCAIKDVEDALEEK